MTTDPGYYEKLSESLELWSPGNCLFTRTALFLQISAYELNVISSIEDRNMLSLPTDLLLSVT